MAGYFLSFSYLFYVSATMSGEFRSVYGHRIRVNFLLDSNYLFYFILKL